MATTFDLFFLGIAPQIDTVEGNITSENHAALEGMIFGSTADPVALNLQTLSPDAANSYTGGALATAYDADNAATTDNFVIDGVTRTHDATMLYAGTTITYTDGTTATINAIVMQATDGALYLLPPTTGPNAYSDALETKPILSVTLGTATPANGTNVYAMAADRYDIDVKDYVVEGTAGNDLIDTDYKGDPEGDRIDNTDNLTGTNDDLVLAGAGDDTVRAGAGDDTVFGGTGNDLIEGGTGNDSLLGEAGNDTLDGGTGADTLIGGAGDDTFLVSQGDLADGGEGDDTFILADLGEAKTGTITIIGGEGGETRGDTLVLTPDISKSDITFTNTDDEAGGRSGTFKFNDTVVNFSEIENIICFTPGARILTQWGERPVESLRLGDMVVTRDHGLQPLRWIGKRTVPGLSDFAPISVASSVMGGQEALLVSPQHRLLFTGYQAELLFGESEVLIAAKHMVNGRDVTVSPRDAVTYIHIMFDRHEIIYADGIGTESFYAGDMALGAIEAAAREELFAIFPELRSAPGQHRNTARPCLRHHEAQILCGLDERDVA
ncbi:MAG: Hint domain-containing protein [Roseovarius sp.]